jgi:hypothetical protein
LCKKVHPTAAIRFEIGCNEFSKNKNTQTCKIGMSRFIKDKSGFVEIYLGNEKPFKKSFDLRQLGQFWVQRSSTGDDFGKI